MIYRKSKPNTLVEPRSILVQWDWDENNDNDLSNNITTINQEDFDISSFCTAGRMPCGCSLHAQPADVLTTSLNSRPTQLD